MLKKIIERVGFTRTETRVIVFLIIVLAAGYSYKSFIRLGETSEYKNFDYSKEDSLFASIGDSGKGPEKEALSENKKFDYKREVLDFNRSNLKETNSPAVPAEKSINLNEAGIDELVMLAGIGKKTAEKIIELRNRKGRFNKLDELLEVKGIGNSKLNIVKKYLFIE